jgi:hypothetical protein
MSEGRDLACSVGRLPTFFHFGEFFAAATEEGEVGAGERCLPVRLGFNALGDGIAWCRPW